MHKNLKLYLFHVEIDKMVDLYNFLLDLLKIIYIILINKINIIKM
jgi:hypothetical protein